MSAQTKAYITTGVVALVAVAIVAAIQRHVMALPVVGTYLPK